MAGPPPDSSRHNGFRRLGETSGDFSSPVVSALPGVAAPLDTGVSGQKPKSMEAIIDAFIAELVPTVRGLKASEWLHGIISSNAGPVELMKRFGKR